jgi:hypothetical protein
MLQQADSSPIPPSRSASLELSRLQASREVMRSALRLHLDLLRDEVHACARELVGAPVQSAFCTDPDGYEQVVITVDDLVVRVADLFPDDIRSERDEHRLDRASFLSDGIYEIERCETLLSTIHQVEVTRVTV